VLYLGNLWRRLALPMRRMPSLVVLTVFVIGVQRMSSQGSSPVVITWGWNVGVNKFGDAGAGVVCYIRPGGGYLRAISHTVFVHPGTQIVRPMLACVTCRLRPLEEASDSEEQRARA